MWNGNSCAPGGNVAGEVNGFIGYSINPAGSAVSREVFSQGQVQVGTTIGFGIICSTGKTVNKPTAY